MIDGFQGVAEIQGETGREVHSFEDLKTWLESRKESQKVSISRITLKDCTPWFYDEDSGQIRNPFSDCRDTFQFFRRKDDRTAYHSSK